GLGLAAAVVLLLRRRPMLAVWLPSALGASCVALGAALIAGASKASAGESYFVLILFVAVGMAGRDHRWTRAAWLVVVAAASIGLWRSASRSAAGAVLLTGAFAFIWLMTEPLPKV